MSDDPILAALARLEAGLGRLEGEQIRLRVDLMQRMDRLENGLTDIRNDISTNFGTADAVKRANDNTREELRSLFDVVSGINRKLMRLEARVRDITGDP